MNILDAIEGQVTIEELAECNWLIVGEVIIRYHNDYRQIWRGDIQDVPGKFRSEIVDSFYIDGIPEIVIRNQEEG